jgi:putative membrane protein
MSGPATPLPDATRLALDRTRLAYERTLMAWVRTSASLISFGFTFYKFFQTLHDSTDGARPQRFITPRGVAVLLISVGVVGLALAIVEHRRHLDSLRAEYGDVPTSTAGVMAAIVSVLGVLGLVAVLFSL